MSCHDMLCRAVPLFMCAVGRAAGAARGAQSELGVTVTATTVIVLRMYAGAFGPHGERKVYRVTLLYNRKKNFLRNLPLLKTTLLILQRIAKMYSYQTLSGGS